MFRETDLPTRNGSAGDLDLVGLKARRVPELGDLRALVFDVQGTCADYYQPLLRFGEQVNRAKNLDVNWAEMAAQWRDLYRSVLDEVIAGKRAWLRVDHIYRETLDTLLLQRNLRRVHTHGAG